MKHFQSMFLQTNHCLCSSLLWIKSIIGVLLLRKSTMLQLPFKVFILHLCTIKFNRTETRIYTLATVLFIISSCCFGGLKSIICVSSI